MVYITRREYFNAAHKLYNPNWSQEKNLEVFGKCALPHFHGHNYELFVTIKGEPSEDTGYVMDLKELSRIIKEQVVEDLDHRNLNLDVPWLKDVLTSTENIVKAIWKRLAAALPSGTLHCVKLYETQNNYVEYFGE